MAKASATAEATASAFDVRTYEEAVATDEVIAELLAKRTEKLAHYDLEVKELRDKRTEYADHSLREIMANFDALRAYVFEHRTELAEGDKKSFTFPGEALCRWYASGKAIVFKRGTKVDTIIERIKKLRVRKFLRLKYEVNKEAMLADQEKAQSIEGVRVRESQELFAYTPRGRSEVLRYNLETGKTVLELSTEEASPPSEDDE